MRISAAFPSNYLKASDLHGKGEVRLTIRSIEMENVGEGEDKPVMYFHGTEKGLPLNKTNALMIADSYGDETEAWINQPVILFEEKVPFKGKPTPAVRVKIPLRTQQQTAPGGFHHQPAQTQAPQQNYQQPQNGYAPQQHAPPPNGNGYGYAENPGAGMSQRDPNEPPF